MLPSEELKSKLGTDDFLSSMRVIHDEQLLSSSHEQLTAFLKGGLPFGALTEWGLPWGHELREMILSFISTKKKRPHPLWTLWIHTRPNIFIYPPAWKARGIDLAFIRFAFSQQPLIDLRSALLDSFFKRNAPEFPR